MTAHGNLIIIFGIVVFYSFIIWGVGHAYGDKETSSMIDFSGVNVVPKDQFIVWTVLENAGGFLVSAGGFMLAVFKMATYSDPRIPVLISQLIITPMNIMLLGAIAFLARGGGS